MVTFEKLKNCFEIAKQNISTPDKRIYFTREEFISKIGCSPEELEAVCMIKRLGRSHTEEEKLTFDFVERIVNSCNQDEICVSYHNGAFYKLYTEYIPIFEIVDVSD